MRVVVEVEERVVVGGAGRVPGLCLQCQRCEHETEVMGQSERSFVRGVMQLKADCPNGEQNYYVRSDE